MSHPHKLDDPKLQDFIFTLLKRAGEDPSREGLARTPKRFLKALSFLTSGYEASLEEVVNGALFDSDSSEMVIVRNIEIYSLCEHHLLPFFGKCHVGYIPDKKILGLSKIARIADLYGRRFQVQERLTGQIADALMQTLKPLGVGVVIEASHLCMMMRGVEKQNSVAKTSALRGQYLATDTRSEFFNLIS